MSVNFTRMQQIFLAADQDLNGLLTRQEVAQASLSLLERDDTRLEGSLLATMVVGGTDQQGLFPDFDGNRQISLLELGELARSAGALEAFEPSDFAAAFGARFNPNGSPIDRERLRAIANTQPVPPPVSLFPPPGFPVFPPPSLPPFPFPGGGGLTGFAPFLEQILFLLQSVWQFFLSGRA